MLENQDEVQLLLLLARSELTDEEAEKAARIASAKPDWDYFLSQASRHRVLPLVARNMQRLELHQLDSYIYANFDTAIGTYFYHSARNRALHAEFADVMPRLYAEVPRVVIRKGMYLAHVVYPDPGVRPMMDLDLLVERENAKRAVEVLEDLGYASGKPTHELRRIEPLPRDEQVYWRMHVVNNLPTLFRPTSDPLVRLFAVDFTVGIFLTALQCEISTSDVVERADDVRVAGARALVPAPEDLILDLCAHLYKESTTLRYMHRLKYQRLIQYCDLRESLLHLGDRLEWERLLGLCDTYDAHTTVYFALAHLEELYSGTVPASVLDRLRPDDQPDFLDQYAATELPEPQVWQEPFLARTFSRTKTLSAPPARSPL